MKAFHNDPKIKSKYLKRVLAHRAADEIVHGQYWAYGRGCAVGCTIHSGTHSAYEEELGIPAVIAHIEDYLFERMDNGDSLSWPERFLQSIPVGADLSHVHGKFFAMTLLDEEIGFWKVWKSEEDQRVFKDFGNFIAFLATDKPFNKKDWESVRHPFIASLARLARLDSLDSLASRARLARLDRLDSLARLASRDRLDSLARLARLDSLDSLASRARLARLDRLDSLARLDSLDRLDSLASRDRLDRLDSLDVHKIASDRLIDILKATKPN